MHIRILFYLAFLLFHSQAAEAQPLALVNTKSYQAYLTKTGKSEKPFPCIITQLNDSSICIDSVKTPLCLNASDIYHIRIVVVGDRGKNILGLTLGGFLLGGCATLFFAGDETDFENYLIASLSGAAFGALVGLISRQKTKLDFEIRGKQLHYIALRERLQPYVKKAVQDKNPDAPIKSE